MRPRRLRLGTHVGRCIMWTGIRLLLLIHFSFTPNFQHWNFSSHFSQELWVLEDWKFLSNYQTLKIFVTFFSGTVGSRGLKLGTHMDSGQMYCVYRNRAAAAYLFLYFFIYLSNFQALKFFVTLFSRTARPRRSKLGTRGQWEDVSYIPESGCCCLFVPLFPFSPIFKR